MKASPQGNQYTIDTPISRFNFLFKRFRRIRKMNAGFFYRSLCQNANIRIVLKGLKKGLDH